MDQNLFTGFQNLNRWWSHILYIYPILEITVIVCLFYLIRQRINSRFKKLTFIYLISIFFLFFITDVGFVLYFAVKREQIPGRISVVIELLNSAFQLYECYFIYTLLNFGLENKLLTRLRNVALGLLTCYIAYNSLSLIQSELYASILFKGEFLTAISYTLLLPGILSHYYIQYKQELRSPLDGVTTVSILSYVLISLLIFPIASYFLLNHSKMGHALNIIHCLLLIWICILLTREVVSGKCFRKPRYLFDDIGEIPCQRI